MARKTMKRLMILLAAVVLQGTVGFSSPARAQDKVIHEEDKTVFKKKTVIDFNDVT
jgi:hypothetical protein